MDVVRYWKMRWTCEPDIGLSIYVVIISTVSGSGGSPLDRLERG